MHDKPYVMTRYTEKQVSVQLILALCLGGVWCIVNEARTGHTPDSTESKLVG